MAYDERLADQVRKTMLGEPGLSERKMFGGLAFMLDGHMCCGIVGNELMLRLGADGAETALEHAHGPTDSTGRPTTGIVYVAPEQLSGDALNHWLNQATAYVRTSRQSRRRPRRRTSGPDDAGHRQSGRSRPPLSSPTSRPGWCPVLELPSSRQP